jgi:AcrR family transcriptional regulator
MTKTLDKTDRVTGFAAVHGITATDLCRGVHARFADSIQIKKPHVVAPNLERILLVALDLGNQKGFHSMSMRDLADASGLSMGALYNYIEDKNTLPRMILVAVSDAVDRVLTPADASECDDPRERLRGLIRRHVLLTEAMQPWFAFAFMEVKAFDKEARELAMAEELRTERLLSVAIADGTASGAFRPVDPTVTAGLVKPLLQDWYLKRWKHRRRGTSPEAYAETVIEFVERAILA